MVAVGCVTQKQISPDFSNNNENYLVRYKINSLFSFKLSKNIINGIKSKISDKKNKKIINTRKLI